MIGIGGSDLGTRAIHKALNHPYHNEYAELTLDELPLQVCNQFWGKHKENVSAYDKFKILSKGLTPVACAFSKACLTKR